MFAGACALLLTTCSSGASKPAANKPPHASTTTTTTTTVPTEAVQASVQAYFAGKGAPLIAFRRATRLLATGKPVSRAECDRLATKDLPAVTPGFYPTLALAKEIPDPVLAGKVQDDVFTKNLLLTSCRTSRPIPKDLWRKVQQFSDSVDLRLAQFGVTA